jgi:hypothetical protein
MEDKLSVRDEEEEDDQRLSRDRKMRPSRTRGAKGKARASPRLKSREEKSKSPHANPRVIPLAFIFTYAYLTDYNN